MLTCYLDESGTDNGLPDAVVGGVVLRMGQHYYLNQEWSECLKKHKVPNSLHMTDFGEHGKLGAWNSEQRRALLTDVVRVINGNKVYSIAGTLSRDSYLRAFDGITGLSMYGAAFLMVVMANGIVMQRKNYSGQMAYILDDGNRYRADILEARNVILSKTGPDKETMGTLDFESDKVLAELQVADVVSWSVRRRLSSVLKSGFEPLTDLFDEHLEAPYKEEWMIGVADSLRGTQVS